MKLRVWIAGLLVALMPAVAGAVTLALGDVAEGFNTSSSFAYENDSLAIPVKIRAFTITFNSTEATRLASSTWTFTDPAGAVTGPIAFMATPLGTGFIAMASIPAFVVAVGESFTVDFGVVGPGTSGSFSFHITPVPLPAAGWMLLAAVSGMAILARRQRLFA